MNTNGEKAGQYMWFSEGFLVALSDDPRLGYGLAPGYGIPYSQSTGIDSTFRRLRSHLRVLVVARGLG